MLSVRGLVGVFQDLGLEGALTDLFAPLLAILLAWPQSLTPEGLPLETQAAREERYETIAGASTQAARDGKGWTLPVRVAGIITVWQTDNNLDPFIHAGVPHPDPRRHEDHGKARCLGSVHRNDWFTFEQWRALAGTSYSATLRCARATLRLLRSQWWICGKDRGDLETQLAWTLQQYATGAKECAEPCQESKDRARFWVELANQLGGAK